MKSINIIFLYKIVKNITKLTNINKLQIKILIIDFEFERGQNESLKQSKEIICPICN